MDLSTSSGPFSMICSIIPGDAKLSPSRLMTMPSGNKAAAQTWPVFFPTDACQCVKPSVCGSCRLKWNSVLTCRGKSHLRIKMRICCENSGFKSASTKWTNRLIGHMTTRLIGKVCSTCQVRPKSGMTRQIFCTGRGQAAW